MPTESQPGAGPGTWLFLQLLERSYGNSGRWRVRIAGGESFIERKANPNNNREEPGSGQGATHPPFAEQAAGGPGSPAAQQHPTSLARHVDHPFPRGQESFKAIPPIRMLPVIVGENTQTDGDKIKNNF